VDVTDLKEVALRKSQALGHDLSGWVRVDDGDASAWRASCIRCGEVVYVRGESGLLGLAGTILTQPCPQADD
jgi:hypothetical protein